MTEMEDTHENSAVAPIGAKSLSSHSVSGAMWISLETALSQSISLLAFLIISHYITPLQFGKISICYAIIYSLRCAFFEPITLYIVRTAAPSDAEYAASLYVSTLCGMAWSLFLLVFSTSIEHILAIQDLGELIAPMGLTLLLAGVGKVHEAWLTKHFKFRQLAMLRVGASLVGGVVGVGAAIDGAGAFAIVFQQIVTSLSLSAFLWLAVSWRPSLKPTRAALSSLAGFMATRSSNALLYVASENLDVVLINYFFGVSSAGLYAFAKRLKLALQLAVSTPINGVTLPIIATVKNDVPRLKRVVKKGITLIAVAGTPIFFGVAVIARPAILLSFGERWEGATPIMSIMAVSLAFTNYFAIYDAILMSFNKQALYFALTALSTILSIVIISLMYVVGVKDSFYVALPFIIPACFVTFTLCTGAVLKLIGIDLIEWAWCVAPSLFASLIFYLIICLVPTPSNVGIELAQDVLIGVTVYTSLMYFTSKSNLHSFIDVLREAASQLVGQRI